MSDLNDIFIIGFNNKYIKTLKFLQNICKGRDPSHGFEHGVTVFRSALRMYNHDVRTYRIKYSKNTVKI